MRKIFTKTLSVFVASLFLINTVSADLVFSRDVDGSSVSTLSPQPGTVTPHVMRSLIASLYRGELPAEGITEEIRDEWGARIKERLIFHPSEDAPSTSVEGYLDSYGGKALLLPNGKYLIGRATYRNDLLLVRAVTHEDYEILMQREEFQHEEGWYKRVQDSTLDNELILSTYNTLLGDARKSENGDLPSLLAKIIEKHKLGTGGRKIPERFNGDVNEWARAILFHDIVATHFELTFIEHNHIVERLSAHEGRFLEAAKHVMTRDNFSVSFFDISERTAVVRRLQNDKAERFFRTTSPEGRRDPMKALQNYRGNKATRDQFLDVTNAMQKAMEASPEIREFIESVHGKTPEDPSYPGWFFSQKLASDLLIDMSLPEDKVGLISDMHLYMLFHRWYYKADESLINSFYGILGKLKQGASKDKIFSEMMDFFHALLIKTLRESTPGLGDPLAFLDEEETREIYREEGLAAGVRSDIIFGIPTGIVEIIKNKIERGELVIEPGEPMIPVESAEPMTPVEPAEPTTLVEPVRSEASAEPEAEKEEELLWEETITEVSRLVDYIAIKHGLDIDASELLGQYMSDFKIVGYDPKSDRTGERPFHIQRGEDRRIDDLPVKRRPERRRGRRRGVTGKWDREMSRLKGKYYVSLRDKNLSAVHETRRLLTELVSNGSVDVQHSSEALMGTGGRKEVAPMPEWLSAERGNSHGRIDEIVNVASAAAAEKTPGEEDRTERTPVETEEPEQPRVPVSPPSAPAMGGTIKLNLAKDEDGVKRLIDDKLIGVSQDAARKLAEYLRDLGLLGLDPRKHPTAPTIESAFTSLGLTDAKKSDAKRPETRAYRNLKSREYYASIKGQDNAFSIWVNFLKTSEIVRQVIVSSGKRKKVTIEVAVRGEDDKAHPAIVLRENADGKWEHAEITRSQHKIINEIWGEAWDEWKNSHRVDGNNVIVHDIISLLERSGIFHEEINIHSPPDEEIYSKIAILDREGAFIDLGQWRLITHPGTNKGGSLNLLIPKQEFNNLMEMRESDIQGYNEWLSHEVKHLVDRFENKGQRRKNEKQILESSGVSVFEQVYNSRSLGQGSLAQLANPYGINEALSRQLSAIRSELRRGMKSSPIVDDFIANVYGKSFDDPLFQRDIRSFINTWRNVLKFTLGGLGEHVTDFHLFLIFRAIQHEGDRGKLSLFAGILSGCREGKSEDDIFSELRDYFRRLIQDVFSGHMGEVTTQEGLIDVIERAHSKEILGRVKSWLAFTLPSMIISEIINEQKEKERVEKMKMTSGEVKLFAGSSIFEYESGRRPGSRVLRYDTMIVLRDNKYFYGRGESADQPSSQRPIDDVNLINLIEKLFSTISENNGGRLTMGIKITRGFHSSRLLLGLRRILSPKGIISDKVKVDEVSSRDFAIKASRDEGSGGVFYTIKMPIHWSREGTRLSDIATIEREAEETEAAVDLTGLGSRELVDSLIQSDVLKLDITSYVAWAAKDVYITYDSGEYYCSKGIRISRNTPERIVKNERQLNILKEVFRRLREHNPDIEIRGIKITRGVHDNHLKKALRELLDGAVTMDSPEDTPNYRITAERPKVRRKDKRVTFNVYTKLANGEIVKPYEWPTGRKHPSEVDAGFVGSGSTVSMTTTFSGLDNTALVEKLIENVPDLGKPERSDIRIRRVMGGEGFIYDMSIGEEINNGQGTVVRSGVVMELFQEYFDRIKIDQGWGKIEIYLSKNIMKWRVHSILRTFLNEKIFATTEKHKDGQATNKIFPAITRDEAIFMVERLANGMTAERIDQPVVEYDKIELEERPSEERIEDVAGLENNELVHRLFSNVLASKKIEVKFDKKLKVTTALTIPDDDFVIEKEGGVYSISIGEDIANGMRRVIASDYGKALLDNYFGRIKVNKGKEAVSIHVSGRTIPSVLKRALERMLTAVRDEKYSPKMSGECRLVVIPKDDSGKISFSIDIMPATGDPAIILREVDGKWTHAEISKEQHGLINEIWGEAWNRWNEDYRLDEENPIYKDVAEGLVSSGITGEEINIHAPPGEEVYGGIASKLDGTDVFKRLGEWRLITHPGTNKGKSLNLLIPRRELDILRKMRENDNEAYIEWLRHEITHLVDRFVMGRERKTEAQILLEAGVGNFERFYNAYQEISQELHHEVSLPADRAERFRRGLAEFHGAKGMPVGINPPTLNEVNNAFDHLEEKVRQSQGLNSEVSRAASSMQAKGSYSKLRFSVPIDVLRNSPDAMMTLKRIHMLNGDHGKDKTPFELVITGVREEDRHLVVKLGSENVKRELGLAEKLVITVITEQEIEEASVRTRESLRLYNMDEADLEFFVRIIAIKELAYEKGGRLGEREHMAITLNIPDNESAERLKAVIDENLIDNISVRLVFDDVKNSKVFSLAAILKDWMDAIKTGKRFSVGIIPPIKADYMMKELSVAMNTAWKVLVAV